MTDPILVIEAAVAEADALLRERLAAAGIKVPHAIVAVTPAGAGIVRANCGPEMLRDIASGLRRVADEGTGKATKTRH